MSLEDLKIEGSDIALHGVVAAPDKLMGTAQENKGVFDRLIREAVSQRFNALIDHIMANPGGGSGAGGESVFYAVCGFTTSAEIEAAYQAGKAVYVYSEKFCGPLWCRASDTCHVFLSYLPYDDGMMLGTATCAADSWSLTETPPVPVTHASSHAEGGSDPITPSMITPHFDLTTMGLDTAVIPGHSYSFNATSELISAMEGGQMSVAFKLNFGSEAPEVPARVSLNCVTASDAMLYQGATLVRYGEDLLHIFLYANGQSGYLASDILTPDSIGAVALTQGTDNAGKSLVVGENGNVTLKEKESAVFYAVYGETTYDEIDAAVTEEKAVFALFALDDGEGIIAAFAGVENGTFSFAFSLGLQYILLKCGPDGWDEPSMQNEMPAHAENHAADGFDPITPDAIGAVKADQGVDNAGKCLIVGSDGKLAPGDVTNNAYTLPAATADTLGGIRIGEGLAIDENGVLSVTAAVTEELPDGDGVSY